VCDKIASLIADRMAAKMARGEPVAWVRTIRLLAEGLEIESSRAMPERIAWNQIERVVVEQGVFHLWRRGVTRPTIKLPTHLPNFFPGYQVLLERMQQDSNTRTVDA
jgi:hypothetical protein